MTSVLFLGATGYIGGTILVSLVSAYPSSQISALVRNTAHLDAVAATGATPIQGDFSQLDKIADLAEKADVVVNAADSDDVELTGALIKGLRRRNANGLGKGVLIHLSGTAIFSSPAGKVKVWDDLAEDDIRAITPSMIHGPVDTQILAVDESGDINAYILCPSVVHGPGKGPVGRASGFFKFVLRAFFKFKQPIVVGDGEGRKETVHVNDVTSLFLFLFSHAQTSHLTYPTLLPSVHLTTYQKYFIASTGFTDWNDIARLVSGALATSDLEKVKSLTSLEVKRVDGGDENLSGGLAVFLTTNVHTRPGRGRTLGWVPSAPGLEKTIGGDVAAVLSSM